MNKPIRLCIMLLICTVFIGCVTSPENPALTMEGEKKRLTSKFYEKALLLEHQNAFVEAKKNYHLALTADPSNRKARQGILKMNKQLESLADRFYLKSMALYKKGKYSEATQSLLVALRFWPGHVKARQALTAGRKLNIQNYTWHTIKKGETLSIISKNFYGDVKQSGILARVNHIKDAVLIRVGMKLKIPELKGHPFVNQKKTRNPELLTDPITMYKNLGIEFFKNQQFENAVLEFKKVLSADPTDKDSIAYIAKAYYHLGSTAYTQKKFLSAINHFQKALTFDRKCSACDNKILQSRDNYKELHYKAGMKFFDEQNLKRAVLEWNLVQKMDPEYKKVTQLLNKAKTIQKNIEAIRKSD